VIRDLVKTELKIVSAMGGNVMHALKHSDSSFKNFGEAYFSKIKFGYIKAWKRHRKMTLNLIVPFGKIKVVFFDDRSGESVMDEVILSQENYYRLTVPPMIWFGFQGLHKQESIMLNIADIEHDPSEVEREDLEFVNYKWEQL